jgi:hypothetical protein
MKVWFVSCVASLALSLCVLGASGAAYAQDRDAGVVEGATGRETEFVAMTGPAKESVPGGALLVSAYAVILLLLFAFVGRMALLQSSTSKELARLDVALRTRVDTKAVGSVIEPSDAARKVDKAK